MDNLYKKFRLDGELYSVLMEHGFGISCINEDKLKTKVFNFKTEQDLTDFMKEHEVKR